MKELEERVGSLESEVGNIKGRVSKLERTDEKLSENLGNLLTALTEIIGRVKTIEIIGKWFVGLLTTLLGAGIIAVIAYFVGGK